MRYSRSAITQLTRWYKSVLIKCALLNAAFFVSMGAVNANAAAPTITNGDDAAYTWKESGANTGIKVNVDEMDYYVDIKKTGYTDASGAQTLNYSWDDTTKQLTVTNSGEPVKTDGVEYVGNTGTWGGAGNYSSGTIDAIAGDFVGNSATKEGGAIYATGSSQINGITGNFIGNRSNSGNYGGGAIFHISSNSIGTITGDFIGNYAAYKGGAILNTGNTNINSITGDFIGNKAAGNGIGGAIYNYVGRFSSISGNFIANSANQGGAIFNESQGKFDNITGDFIGNSATKNGGAIYTSGYNTYDYTLEGYTNFVDSSFINNTAEQGAAIYAYAGKASVTAKNKNIEFTNNIATGSGTKEGYGIYLTAYTSSYGEVSSVLELNANSGKKITINDTIYSKNVGCPDDGKVVINNDPNYNSGTVIFNNKFDIDRMEIYGGTTVFGTGTAATSLTKAQYLEVYGGTLSIANNNIDTLVFGEITDRNSFNLAIDVDAGEIVTADKINASLYYSSSSPVYLSVINFINSTAESGEVQIADGNFRYGLSLADDVDSGIYATVSYDKATGILSFADPISWLKPTLGSDSAYKWTQVDTEIMPVNWTIGDTPTTFYVDILKKSYTDNTSAEHDLKYTWNNENHQLSVTNSDDTALVATAVSVTGEGSSTNPYVLTGDYTGNNNSLGFARWDRVDSITGDFIGNTKGGIGLGMGITIGNIKSNFIGNSGGRAFSFSGDHSWSTNINSIKGDFIGNSSGAIYIFNWNNGGIGTVIGDFIGNKADNGGAILLADSHINSVIGNFVNNYAGNNGGALQIGDGKNGAYISVTGDFIANQAVSKGGALYNTKGATTKLIDSSFIGNIAPEGAAIYIDKGEVTVTAQNKDIEFTNNNSTGTTGGDGYGIYNISSGSRPFVLNAKEGRTITVNDKVYSEQKISINNYYAGDWSAQNGTVIFNNEFTQTGATEISSNESNAGGGTVEFNGTTSLGNLDVSGTATLKLGTAAGNSIFGAVTFSRSPILDVANGSVQTLNVASIRNNAKLNIDLDFTGDSVLADAINITTGGKTGVLTLDGISAIGTIREFANLEILKGTTDGVTLALSAALQTDTRFNGEEREIITGNINTYKDSVAFDEFANNEFVDETYAKKVANRLFVTDGTKLSYDEITTVPEYTKSSTKQDVLQALNQSTSATRSLTTTDATKTYAVGADLGTTGAGTLTVQGAVNGENKSTLNMATKSGFVISNADTTLNLTNLNIINLKDTADGGLLNISGEGSKANLQNVTVASTTNNAIVNMRELNLSGVNSIAKITGAIGVTNITDGTTTITANGSVTQDKVNLQGGRLFVNSGATVTANIIGDENYSFDAGSNNGGAVFNEGTISRMSGTYKGNSSAVGGAVFNNGTINTLSANFDGNSSAGNAGALFHQSGLTISSLTGNFSNNTAYESGGAILNRGGTITTLTGDFEGNRAQWGGAIFNMGIMNLVDSSFRNNIGIVNGAAIQTKGETAVTTVIAKTKDVEFTNNNSTGTAEGTGTGIYVESGTLNLNANTDKKLIINDEILSVGNININTDENYNGGTVILNGELNLGYKTVNLAGGTLKLGTSAATANFGGMKVSNTATLDLQNEAAQNTGLDTISMTSSDELKLKVDYDGSTGNMDKLIIEGGSGKITLNAIKVIADGDATSTRYLAGAAKNNITIVSEAIVAATEDWRYTFTPSATDKGLLNITRKNLNSNLATAMADATIGSYTMNSDFTFDESGQGTLAGEGRNFTIFGQDHVIAGGGTSSYIKTSADQTLNIENATFQNMYPAISNQGNLNLKNVLFAAQDYIDVINNGTLNLDGINTVNYIAWDNDNPSKIVNVNSGTTTVRQAIYYQSELNVAEGATLILGNGYSSIQTAFDNKGTVEVANRLILNGADMKNSGTINGDGEVQIYNDGDGTAYMENTGTMNNVLVSTKGTLKTAAENINGTLKSNGTLLLSGTLNKDIEAVDPSSATGTIKIDGTLKVDASGAEENTIYTNHNVFDLNNGTLDMKNGKIDTLRVNFNNATGAGNLALDIDLSGETVANDVFSAAGVGIGCNDTVTVSDLNLIGTLKPFEAQILKGDIQNRKLLLSDSVAAQYNKTDTKTRYESDDLTATASWNDTFNTRKYETVTTKKLETYSAVATVENHNSLRYTETTGEETLVEETSEGDTLALLNKTTQFGATERKFVTSDANATHDVSEDLGTTAAGKLTVQGATDGTNTSTIDLKGKDGFKVSDDAEVVLDTVKITGAKAEDGALIDNESGSVTLKDVEVAENSKPAINNDSAMKLSGTNNIDSGIGGNGTTNITDGQTTLGAKLTQKKVNVKSGATLKANADNIDAPVANNGTYDVTGGTIGKDVTGNGATVIKGDVQNKAKVANDITVNAGKSLTSNADNIGGNVTSDGTYNVTGGTIDKNVTGGKLNVKGDVTVGDNAEVSTKSANVAKSASLDVGTNSVDLGDATIDGTVKLEITDIAASSNKYTGGQINAKSLNLGKDSKLSLTIAPNLIAKKTSTGALDIINVSGATTGQFAEMLSNNRYKLASTSDGKFVITNYASVADIINEAGGTGNNIATGETWDETSFIAGSKASEVQNVLNELSQHDEHGYVKALTDLAPTDSMAHVGITQDFNNLIGEQVAARLNREGLNSGDVFEKRGAWIQTLYNHSKQDKNSKNQGFTGKTAGVALGLDGEIKDNLTIGLGYAYGKSDVDSAGRDIDIDGHTLYIYGKYQPSAWYVRGLAHYGFAEYEEKANIAGIANKAKYDVHNYGARAFVGYDMPNGFTPEAGLRLTSIDRKNYTDSFGQHVKSDGIDVLTASLGMNYSTNFAADSFVWSPKAHIAATYDLLSDDSSATVTVGNGLYNIEGKKLHRLGAEAGIGAEIGIGNWEFSAEYDLGARKDYLSHTGMLKAKYNF